jgi:hypothetical protein
LVGLGALYYFQMKAIKAELLKMIESPQRGAPNHQPPSAPVIGGH